MKQKETSLEANINIGKERLIMWHKLMFSSTDTGLILFCSGFDARVSTALTLYNLTLVNIQDSNIDSIFCDVIFNPQLFLLF